MSQQLETNTDNNFMPPSRASEPIINLAIINFHNNSVPVPDCLIPHDNLESSFGIANIHMRDEIPIVKEIHFAFTIDRSGSMSPVCEDGRTKMEHIIHTLENMIRIFHKKTGSKISIRVQSFDESIYVDVETVEDIGQKTQPELEAIITRVHQISPGGATNIAKALIASNKHLDAYISDHPSTKVVQLFLTDGEITEGSTDKVYLKSLVSEKYPNIFMGYGLDHDAPLLKGLASTGLHNEYRFIDNLEKAGLVYGEVIHQLLYPALEDVSLLAENCELYNYATNTWTAKLDVGNLISDQQKIFHIRSMTPDRAQLAIYGRTIHQTKYKEVLSNEIEFQTHVLPIKVELANKCDLTNYLFRQRTQEYLFATNALLGKQYDLHHKPIDPFAKYSMLYQPPLDQTKKDEEFQQIKKEKDLLKQQMKDFFKTMLDYITSKNLKEDDFFKTLCDDMYIALKSFDTQHGMMYAAARQTSQGRQQTYCSIPLSQLRGDLVKDTDDDGLPLVPPSLKRGTTISSNCMPRQQSQCPPPRQQSQSLPSRQLGVDQELDLELDLDLNYTLSQRQTSGYSSIGVLKMMREVSYHPPTEQVTGLSLELPSDLDLP
jgi:hypothetical protein